MIGTTLDSRYRVERELRRDPDAVEYAGVDLRLQRPVRVRMLQPERAADAEYVAAWRSALTQAAALSHPGILPLYDICLDGDAPYVVEAQVDGASLEERLRAGERIEPAGVAAIARQCGRALGAAHAAGLAHGHVGPAAILVDAAGDAFVTGFGLPEGPSPSREQARYLAPEQSVGQPASPRTDVYALAATLYELLSGRPPFDGPNAVAIGTLKNTADAPPLPEAAAGRALLDTIRNGLSRHPLARPADGSAFAAALDSAAPPPLPSVAALSQTAVLPRTPVRPVEPAPVALARPLTAPPPLPAARESGGCGGAVLALLLLAGIGAALVFAFRHPGGNIPVPRLAGKGEAEAKKLLTDLKLRPDIIERAFDDNVPDGHVVSQDPPGEMKLKAGEGVKLVISKGPRFVTVPSLKGMSERQAKTLLAKSGLIFGGSEATQMDGVADGVVTAQSPPAETRVEKSSSVQLFINHPPKPVEPAPATEAKPSDTSKPGLVDQALDRLKDKAGEVAADAVEAGKEKLRQGVEDIKDRAADELQRRLGGDQPAGGKQAGE